MKSFRFCIALLFISHFSYCQIVIDTISKCGNDSCLIEGLNGAFYDDILDSINNSQYLEPTYLWRCYKMDNNDSISFLQLGDMFILEISYQFEEMDVRFVISKGQGKRIDNYFVMTDCDFGYDMKIEFKDDSTIVFQDGFCSFVGNSFSLQGFSDRPIKMEVSDKRNLPYPILSDNYLEKRYKSDTICLLDTGVYVTDNVRHMCDLHITSESHFKYYIMDILVLDGEIKRNGNCLLLHDNCSKSEFVGFVKDDTFQIRLPLRSKGFNEFRKYEEVPENPEDFKVWLRKKRMELIKE